jgi:Ricin-type beta-trefoil lectin domain
MQLKPKLVAIASAMTLAAGLTVAFAAPVAAAPTLNNIESGTPVSGHCLDANSNGYPLDGDPIQLWSCSFDSEQSWYFNDLGFTINGHEAYNIVNEAGLCLDANSNNYPSNGDAIQLWACNTNPEQIWWSHTLV